jgi:aspartate/methionine/tyrosine aminotransferase
MVASMGRAKIDSDLLASLRPEALAPAASGIVELFNLGRGRPGVIPLWVGEGDLPNAQFVLDAARKSLDAGETFYAAQRGLPELRAAIARYMTLHYRDADRGASRRFTPDHFSVTTGGMHALQIALRLVAGSGAEVIVPTPAWPNFAGALAACGAEPIEVPLNFAAGGNAPEWRLDIDPLTHAVTPSTRAIIINSPGNPTGWTASLDELRAVLEISRRHGLWIVADEIYGRIVFDGARAPSFHDVMEDDDRILFVQTMSKNWAMTGLRLGWIEAPPEFGPVIENLIQYSTSGVPTPIQRAAIAALDLGEPFVAAQLTRMRESRDILCRGLAATGRARFAEPSGSFYLFCVIDGFPNSRDLAIRLLDEALVGVAPGTAFGAAGAPFLRLCFARDPGSIAEATRRLSAWLFTEKGIPTRDFGTRRANLRRGDGA